MIRDCLSTEKTKNPEQIEVYTVQQKGVRKRVVRTTLSAFWKKDSVIRINNIDDKQETPNSEKDIRAKVKNPTNIENSRAFPIHNFEVIIFKSLFNQSAVIGGAIFNFKVTSLVI